MPALAIVPSPEPSPADQLAALKIERGKLHDEAKRLAGIRSRLNDAETAEREALAAIGELGRSEITAMTEWASAGAAGDPPQPDIEQRSALAKQLAGAQAACTAAKGAAAEIDEQRGAFMQKLSAIDAEIEALAFAILEDDLATALDDLKPVAEQACRLVAKIRAQSLWFGSEGRRLQNVDKMDQAMLFFRRAEVLRSVALPEAAPTIGDVDLAQRDWAERFHALLRG
jgi:hypothetical protein